MNDMTRWSLTISRDVDIALRTHLAERGGRKGDLSRYVEEAVNRKMLQELVSEIRERNAHHDPAEIERIIDEELAEVRKAKRRPKA